MSPKEDLLQRRDPTKPRETGVAAFALLACMACATETAQVPARSAGAPARVEGLGTAGVPAGVAAPAGISAPSRPPAARRERVLGWVAVAIGAEAAIVSAVTSVILLHQKSVRTDNCNGAKECPQRGLDANSTIDSLVPWNTGAWIVTALGLGAGGYLLLTHRPQTPQRTVIAVSPSPSGIGVALGGTF